MWHREIVKSLDIHTAATTLHPSRWTKLITRSSLTVSSDSLNILKISLDGISSQLPTQQSQNSHVHYFALLQVCKLQLRDTAPDRVTCWVWITERMREWCHHIRKRSHERARWITVCECVRCREAQIADLQYMILNHTVHTFIITTHRSGRNKRQKNKQTDKAKITVAQACWCHFSSSLWCCMIDVGAGL